MSYITVTHEKGLRQQVLDSTYHNNEYIEAYDYISLLLYLYPTTDSLTVFIYTLPLSYTYTAILMDIRVSPALLSTYIYHTSDAYIYTSNQLSYAIILSALVYSYAARISIFSVYTYSALHISRSTY